jgi:amino acid permease
VAVEVFGEAEFWFASIKFITIMGLIILGFVIMLGGSPNDQGRLGFRYWQVSTFVFRYKASHLPHYIAHFF